MQQKAAPYFRESSSDTTGALQIPQRLQGTKKTSSQRFVPFAML